MIFLFHIQVSHINLGPDRLAIEPSDLTGGRPGGERMARWSIVCVTGVIQWVGAHTDPLLCLGMASPVLLACERCPRS